MEITHQKRTDLDWFRFPAGKRSRTGKAQLPNSHKNKTDLGSQEIPKCRWALSHNLEMFGCSGIGKHFPKVYFVLFLWPAVREEGTAGLLWLNQTQISSPIMNFQLFPGILKCKLHIFS